MLWKTFNAHVRNDAVTWRSVIRRRGDVDIYDNRRFLLQLCCNNTLCIMNLWSNIKICTSTSGPEILFANRSFKETLFSKISWVKKPLICKLCIHWSVQPLIFALFQLTCSNQDWITVSIEPSTDFLSLVDLKLRLKTTVGITKLCKTKSFFK